MHLHHLPARYCTFYHAFCPEVFLEIFCRSSLALSLLSPKLTIDIGHPLTQVEKMLKHATHNRNCPDADKRSC